jgi:hypothetical protein
MTKQDFVKRSRRTDCECLPSLIEVDPVEIVHIRTPHDLTPSLYNMILKSKLTLVEEKLFEKIAPIRRFWAHLLTFTPYQPKKNLDRTICLRPNFGPKVEKKQTGIMPRMFMKKIVRMVSTNPR